MSNIIKDNAIEQSFSNATKLFDIEFEKAVQERDRYFSRRPIPWGERKLVTLAYSIRKEYSQMSRRFLADALASKDGMRVGTAFSALQKWHAFADAASTKCLYLAGQRHVEPLALMFLRQDVTSLHAEDVERVQSVLLDKVDRQRFMLSASGDMAQKYLSPLLELQGQAGFEFIWDEVKSASKRRIANGAGSSTDAVIQGETICSMRMVPHVLNRCLAAIIRSESKLKFDIERAEERMARDIRIAAGQESTARGKQVGGYTDLARPDSEGGLADSSQVESKMVDHHRGDEYRDIAGIDELKDTLLGFEDAEDAIKRIFRSLKEAFAVAEYEAPNMVYLYIKLDGLPHAITDRDEAVEENRRQLEEWRNERDAKRIAARRGESDKRAGWIEVPRFELEAK